MRASILLLAVSVLVAVGCVLDSQQVTISFPLQPDSLVATSAGAPAKCNVRLLDSEEFATHAGEIRGLVDVALLGRTTDTGLTFVDVEWWMTRAVTSYATAAEVRASGLRIWRGLKLAPHESLLLDWNKSAGHFDRDMVNPLLAELRGDGIFTLYALSGTPVSYTFTVLHPTLVLVLDTSR